MKKPAKSIYVITGLLYFPIGTVLAWYAYHDILTFIRKCQHDRVQKKIKYDNIIMISLIIAWFLAFILIVMPELY